MLGIVDHIRGVSPAADRVWVEVAGCGPSKANKRVLVVWQAVIDDSQDAGGTFVLAGYLASAEAWAEFNREWELLLPDAPVGRSGKHRFKMAEMARSPELLAKVPAFYRVIEKYVIGAISTKIHVPDLYRVQKRLFVPKMDIDWGNYANPYFVAFRCLMDKFHAERPNMGEWIPDDQKIDFIFDRHSAKGAIDTMWENYMKQRPEELKKYYGAGPSFKDDEEFMPLQAADFWAWWVRKWYLDGTPEKIIEWDFEGFETSLDRKVLRIEITFNQDQLAETMTQVLRSELGPEKPIVDLRGLDAFDPKPDGQAS